MIRSRLAWLVAVALVSGVVAAAVSVAAVTLTSRTNPQELNLGSRVSLTEDSAAIQVASRDLPAVVTVLTDPGGRTYGSGFVTTTDGFIVTAVPVVAGATTLSVLIPGDGRLRDARVVDYDCATGIAVLKVDQVQNLPTLDFGDSSQLKPGQSVIVLGGPFGGRAVAKGVVSAVHQSEAAGGSVPHAGDSYTDTLVTDVPVDVAAGGGPVLNVGGQVVGVTMSVSAGGQDRSFAISSNSVRAEVQGIVQTGRLTVADLGLETIDLSPEQAAVRGSQVGSLVTAVTPGGLAAVAGIRIGDLVTQLDDNKLSASRPLVQVLRSDYRPSQRTTVTYIRGSETSQVQVTLNAGRPACS